MPETPKHRLRATVTYTVEYDPADYGMDASLSVNWDGLREIANLEQEALRSGRLIIQDFPAREMVAKVEVIR